ncbi:hypothetical protein J437_LFUL007687 [Ladona fulva]|uniref:Uncharacterized protein n=1 Tax=Ladona fulva TaxID=123851 RepID=A0A8K0K1M5_LADFU|nr:hypothetical protein J437_LFUL007687 [Ladona fulva]
MDEWQNLKNAALKAVESTLGHKPQNKKIEWSNQECNEAIQKRNSDRKKYLKGPIRYKKLKYENSRREASRIVKKKKTAYFISIMLRAKETFRENNTREAYKEINFFKKGFQPSTNICRECNGNLLTDKEKVMIRWKQYFNKLLNPSSNMQSAPPDPRFLQ